MGQRQDGPRHTHSGALAALRLLVPRRPLRYSDALRVAELQAELLLRLSEVKEPPVPTRIISALPRMQLVYDDSPVAGSAHWDGREWIIVVNSRMREPRRRLTLAHEFKHIIDHSTRAYLYTGMARMSPVEQAERAADYFAGCLLMPTDQTKHAALDGCETADDYARRFLVPTGLAATRLHQLGLAPIRTRQVSLLSDNGWGDGGLLDADTTIGAKA